MIEFVAQLLKNDAVHTFVANSDFAWPVGEIIHFVGMALLFGTVGVLDLRLLGFARKLPVGPITNLIYWGVAGFVMCITTGYMFIVGAPGGNPVDYLGNISLQLKLTCIALAGVNVGVFYFSGLARRVEALGPDEDAPVSAKIIAATSLLLWVSVIYFGRLIMYSDAFYTPEFYRF
jgi:hypothetical protein